MGTCLYCYNPGKVQCTRCKVCFFCSEECSQNYKEHHGGDAACAYHRIARKLTQKLDDGTDCLGNAFTNFPFAMMMPMVQTNATSVLTSTIEMLCGYIYAQNTSLTLNSYVASAIVDIGNSTWSRSMMRAAYFPTVQSDMMHSQREQFAVSFLKKLGRLATAQFLVKNLDFDEDTVCDGQIFLIGKVKHHHHNHHHH